MCSPPTPEHPPRIRTCVIVKEANVSVLVGRDCEGQCGVTDDAIHLTRVTHICNDDTTDVHRHVEPAQLSQPSYT